MANSNAEDKKLAASTEISMFYRALAIANANAMHRVMSLEGPDAKISSAETETNRLTTSENLAGTHKCPRGSIWDESLKRCVPLN